MKRLITVMLNRGMHACCHPCSFVSINKAVSKQNVSVSSQMSSWKDYLKTPSKKMSKQVKESKSQSKKKTAEESGHDRPQSPAKEIDSTVNSSSDEDVNTPPIKPRSGKVGTKPAPIPEDVIEEPPTSQDAQYQVVSYKKKQLKMKPEDLCGKFCDKSLYTKKGIIFNILNNQCHGTSQFVRALRIDLSDPAHLNKYLETNFLFLKKTAVLHVHEYYLTSRVNLGMSSDLTLDEYSPSFTFASLSEACYPMGSKKAPCGTGCSRSS